MREQSNMSKDVFGRMAYRTQCDFIEATKW